MRYQVLARKWRPQRFDAVVGQRAVTQTLRNAIKTGRVAQAFVFAGPRGVGKTTTARILARALNCIEGPTPEPCGHCDACLEIAEGRDMDVLEIDAATNTKIEDTRAVIIDGLGIPPVRDRYKLFIIDEFHQLSGHSFNALLKSIEEPPPHAVFIMATTEIGKIPDTILSRSQVFEFRTIPSHAIALQLRDIADAEPITISDEALALLARAADGSMRDAETALDQVRAFAGDTITLEDVSSVLGLVGRDLLLDVLQAVVDEDGAAAFALAGRAVESGYDLKLVCRELSRVVRDLMVLSIDPARITDPDVAPEGERDRLQALVGLYSREDLLRAFDVLTRAEFDIRNATEPRYHLEMALLRWIHLRKLAPLADIIERLQAEGGPARSGSSAAPRGSAPAPSRAPVAQRPAPSQAGLQKADAPATPAPAAIPAGGRREAAGGGRAFDSRPPNDEPVAQAKAVDSATNTGEVVQPGEARGGAPADAVKQAFLSAIEQARAVFYRTVVAQAKRIDISDARVLFSFSPLHRLLKEQVEQNRAWLETITERVAGRRLFVESELQAASPAADPGATLNAGDGAARRDLRELALGDGNLQTLLGVFPSEIRTIEEITDKDK